MAPRKRPKKENKKPVARTKTECQTKKKYISVTKQRYPKKSYDNCHDKFLNYTQITDFLKKTQRTYPNNVQIPIIGKSSQGRPIHMAVISEGSSTSPKMAAMIIAGANGCEWMSISSALYMIDHLAQNKNLVKIMDYFIIPCSNPDAYECSLTHRDKQYVSPNFTNCFPVTLGICDICGISTDCLMKAMKLWKDNFRYDAPERVALIQTISNYQFAIKLLICLHGDGTKIAYPFGFSEAKVHDEEDLKKVAVAGQQGVRNRCFQVGSIYELCGLNLGSMVDFLKTNQSAIKFTYVLHGNKKTKRLDPRKIACYGQDVMSCIRFMARNVYMFYNKAPINPCS